MRVAVIFLDYDRHEHTLETMASIARAGYPYDLITIDRRGVAAAINEGLDKTLEYDAVVTCANDIKMPENWLAKMVQYATAIPNTGMVGIHCVEGQGHSEWINGYEIHKAMIPFGNVLITRAAINAVGYFQEAFDPYGMQDSDYGFRTTRMGFVNYYIPGMQSVHIGHDVGQDTPYRKMKDEGLAKVDRIWSALTKLYVETNNYYVHRPSHY